MGSDNNYVVQVQGMTPTLPAGTRHCGNLCRLVAHRHTEQDPQVPGLIAIAQHCHPILLQIIRQAWLVQGKTDISSTADPAESSSGGTQPSCARAGSELQSKVSKRVLTK